MINNDSKKTWSNEWDAVNNNEWDGRSKRYKGLNYIIVIGIFIWIAVYVTVICILNNRTLKFKDQHLLFNDLLRGIFSSEKR